MFNDRLATCHHQLRLAAVATNWDEFYRRFKGALDAFGGFDTLSQIRSQITHHVRHTAPQTLYDGALAHDDCRSILTVMGSDVSDAERISGLSQLGKSNPLAMVISKTLHVSKAIEQNIQRLRASDPAGEARSQQNAGWWEKAKEKAREAKKKFEDYMDSVSETVDSHAWFWTKTGAALGGGAGLAVAIAVGFFTGGNGFAASPAFVLAGAGFGGAGGFIIGTIVGVVASLENSLIDWIISPNKSDTGDAGGKGGEKTPSPEEAENKEKDEGHTAGNMPKIPTPSDTDQVVLDVSDAFHRGGPDDLFSDQFG